MKQPPTNRDASESTVVMQNDLLCHARISANDDGPYVARRIINDVVAELPV